MAAGGSKLAIYAAIGANLAIAIIKFVASSFTGSLAMEVAFDPNANSEYIVSQIKELEQAIDKDIPHFDRIYIEASAKLKSL